MKSTQHSRSVSLVLAAVASCGVIVGLALSGPAEATQTEQRIKWSNTMLVQLAVEDLDRAVEFYTQTLGLRLQERNDAIQWARIDIGIPNVTIGLGAGKTVKGSGSVSFNLGVEDINAARAALEAKGVVFLGPTMNIPGVVQLADFLDPDGNKIRLAGHSDGYGEGE